MAFENNKLGMSVLISHPQAESIEKQIGMFANAGFQSVFLSCGTTDAFHKIPQWAKIAKAYQIEFEAVHNPSDHVDAVWQGGEYAKKYESMTMRIIDHCSEGEVSKLVLHTGASPLVQVSDTGLELWCHLECYAKSRGIRLCYENANTPALFKAVVDCADSYHGVCHDIGHQQCYTPEMKYQNLYAGRILYTHIHDNMGDGRDMHLLPQDGITDWNLYFQDLKKAKYQGALNLELSCYYSDDYRNMSFEKFVSQSYERLTTLLRPKR